jgi:hypothetical protein
MQSPRTTLSLYSIIPFLNKRLLVGKVVPPPPPLSFFTHLYPLTPHWRPSPPPFPRGSILERSSFPACPHFESFVLLLSVNCEVPIMTHFYSR